MFFFYFFFIVITRKENIIYIIINNCINYNSRPLKQICLVLYIQKSKNTQLF